MPQYKVTYENEVGASDPLQAVKDILFNLNSSPEGGRCFTVEEMGTGRKFSVDLDEEEGNEIIDMRIL